MTREQEYEAALRERERQQEAERLRVHADFLRNSYSHLSRNARSAIMLNARERAGAQS